MGRGWCGQIDVTIEVHQAQVLDVAKIACQDTKGDGAVSSDDHWRQVLLKYLIHSISHTPSNVNDTRRFCSFRFALVAGREPKADHRNR